MSEALEALREGVAALLEARGEGDLAGLVRGAQVELLAPAEHWSMGARDVTAHRVALVAPAAAVATITTSSRAMEAVRLAFADAMRSPTTELAALHVILRLAEGVHSWQEAYRRAPTRDEDAPRPSVEAVQRGAVALLDALGQSDEATILRQAQLEAHVVEGTSPRLVRYVVHLPPTELAALDRAHEVEGRLRAAVHRAATRASESLTVDLALLLP